MQNVVALSSDQSIIANSTPHGVVAIATVQQIGAPKALYVVVTFQSEDEIWLGWSTLISLKS